MSSFSKKFQHICVSLDVNFNESLTNDVVSFEQLGPGHQMGTKFGWMDLQKWSNIAELDSERAEELIGQFNDAFNNTEYNEVLLTRRWAPFMDSIVVSSEGMIKLLKGLNPSKALGPYELHPRVLRS